MRGIRGLVLWSCATEFMERTEDGNALSGSDGERPASGSLVLLSAVTVSKPSTGAAEPLSVGITVGRLAGVTLTFCSTAERMETGGSGAAGSDLSISASWIPISGNPSDSQTLSVDPYSCPALLQGSSPAEHLPFAKRKFPRSCFRCETTKCRRNLLRVVRTLEARSRRDESSSGNLL